MRRASATRRSISSPAEPAESGTAPSRSVPSKKPLFASRAANQNALVGDRMALTGMTPRRWIEYTSAILAGNAIYFLVLYPVLPLALRHLPPNRGDVLPIRFDAGLVLDFLCCVLVYGVIRLAVSHARRWNEKNRRRTG
jgi:hypothetical protein